jgi:hypothetical protein
MVINKNDWIDVNVPLYTRYYLELKYGFLKGYIYLE